MRSSPQAARGLRRVFAPLEFHLDERAAIDPVFQRALASYPGEDSGQNASAFGRIGDRTGARGDVRLSALLEMEHEVGVRNDVRIPAPPARQAADIDAAVE